MSSEWNKRNPDKMRAAHKRWLEKHPEHAAAWLEEYKKTNASKMRETKRRWNSENKERNDARRAERKKIKWRSLMSADLKFKFGITLDEYEAMHAKQNNVCAICGVPASELRRRMSVDHNHETGAVRGLLCNHCNTGLGFFKDSQQILTKAIQYLHEYNKATSDRSGETISPEHHGVPNERGADEALRNP